MAWAESLSGGELGCRQIGAGLYTGNGSIQLLTVKHQELNESGHANKEYQELLNYLWAWQ
ncbi:TPA: hypothetical protein ACH3X2_012091 [Trebouxia sp. C0005]